MSMFVLKVQICKMYVPGDIDEPVNNDYVVIPINTDYIENNPAWSDSALSTLEALIQRNSAAIGLQLRKPRY